MSHSPLPYTVELTPACDDERHVSYAFIADANGKRICDTFNSDVAVIEEEWDDDYDPEAKVGSSFRRQWDAQGKADLEFLAKAGNFHERLVEMVKKFYHGTARNVISPALVQAHLDAHKLLQDLA